jgi:(p)ppGpp synthase/HD superfamily hydrolase
MPNFLTEKFEEALIYSTRLHAEQKRKRSSVPYLAHLLGVTSLVLEDGGGENEAIAALLHDAVEDQGGLETLKEIERRFGSEVANIVDALTDSYSDPKPPWKERKEAYIASLRTASPEVIRVSLTPGLHCEISVRVEKQDGRSLMVVKMAHYGITASLFRHSNSTDQEAFSASW